MGIIKEKLKKVKLSLENKSKPKTFEMLVVVVERNKAQKVIKLLEANGINHSVIGFGNGVAKNLFTLVSNEKEIVYTLIPTDLREKIMNELESQVLEKDKNIGIALTVPLKSMVLSSIKHIEK